MAILYELNCGTVGRIHSLRDGVVTLGRGETNSIVLSGPGVSRVHCRISVQGEQVAVEDMGARNGVYVDGRRILGPVPLRDGARLLVASHALVCRLDNWRTEGAGATKPPAHSPPTKPSPHQGPVVRRARFHVWWFFSWTGFHFGWTIRKHSKG